MAGLLDPVLRFASGVLVPVGRADRTGKVVSAEPVVHGRIVGVTGVLLKH